MKTYVQVKINHPDAESIMEKAKKIKEDFLKSGIKEEEMWKFNP